MMAAWSIAFAAEVILSIWYCDGRLIYSLDDPYIHLAVAENIVRGGYGINLGEYASPSSSIAFPFLLAGTEALGLGAWGLLALNAAAAATAVYGAGLILRRVPPSDRPTSDGAVFIYAVAALVILAMNAVALPLTGLEHMCHVLAVVFCVLGLLQLAAKRPAPWLVAAVVALTLMRFEGIAMAGAMIAAMWFLGDRRGAAVSLGLIVVLLGAYFAFMHALGMPLLPSSVLLKSDLASATSHGNAVANVVAAIYDNLSLSASTPEGQGLALLAAAILVRWIVVWRSPCRPELRAVGFVALVTLGAHLAGGHYGWFGRYEVYAVTAGVLAVMVLYCDLFTSPKFAKASCAGVLVLLTLVSRTYLVPAINTPAAARGIYQQQYQMHRFVTEFWRGPVAVNDLGWVSYRNDNVVLDLIGLGSEPVRRLRAARTFGSVEIEEMARRKHVAVSMIYDEAFPGVVPRSWRKVAVLHTSRVTSAAANVSFYATASADPIVLADALSRFGRTLPRGSRLTIIPSTPAS